AHEALDGREWKRGAGGVGDEGLREPAGDEVVVDTIVADERGEDDSTCFVTTRQQISSRGVEQGDDAVGRAQVDADRLADAGGGGGGQHGEPGRGGTPGHAGKRGWRTRGRDG